MRTWAWPLVGTNLTLAVLPQAFMWDKMRRRKSAGGPSRKPTLSLMPARPQYFVVMTAIRAGVGANPGAKAAMAAIGGRFTGLMLAARSAAARSCLAGNDFGKQTSGAVMVHGSLRNGRTNPEGRDMVMT